MITFSDFRWNRAVPLSWSDTPKTIYYFAKRDNFCGPEIASLVFETFQKWRLLLKERICSLREEVLSNKRRPQWEKKFTMSMSELLLFVVYPSFLRGIETLPSEITVKIVFFRASWISYNRAYSICITIFIVHIKHQLRYVSIQTNIHVCPKTKTIARPTWNFDRYSVGSTFEECWAYNRHVRPWAVCELVCWQLYVAKKRHLLIFWYSFAHRLIPTKSIHWQNLYIEFAECQLSFSRGNVGDKKCENMEIAGLQPYRIFW